MTKYKLGEITKIRTGKLDANASSPDGKYPFFTCSREPLKIDSYSYDCECVLVAGNGDLNVKYYEGKFDAYQRTYIIEDNSDGKLFMPYLYFFLELYIEELRKQSIGGVIKYIKLGNLTNAVINLPSIEDQKSIVNILEKSKSIAEYKATQLSEYDQLIKSRFVEMFGDPHKNPYRWVKKTLKEVAKEKLSYGSGASAIDYDGKTRYIRITDINENGSLNEEMKSPSEYEKKYNLHDGDILFARSGATVGKTLRYKASYGESIYAGYLIRFKPNIKYVLPDYIFHYTKTNFYNLFVEKAQNTVAQPNINARQYGNLIVTVPPIELQQQFAIFVEQVDKLKFEVQKSLDESQILFDSLMQEYFG